MSRLATNHQRRSAIPEGNPYQITSLVPSRTPSKYQKTHPSQRCARKSTYSHPQTSIDIGYSDATTTDTCYDYCDQNGFQHSPLRETRNTDVTFSDDSGSTRLPYFEFDEESNKLYSRNSFSDRSFSNATRYHLQERVDTRTRYQQDQDEPWEERLYHEIQTPCDNQMAPNIRRIPQSRLSDRPQSSMSSALTTNAMVYGCGGKCQTFESICYFVLQLMFTMGILIGVSLCIAGLVLRKSAARNLQVLVYIGILLALVSALLLTIQCRAKNTARRRIKAIQMAKRAPIQMETLNVRVNPLQAQRMLGGVRESQRIKQLPQVHTNSIRPLPQRPHRLDHHSSIEEEQGIPWWRRKDLKT